MNIPAYNRESLHSRREQWRIRLLALLLFGFCHSSVAADDKAFSFASHLGVAVSKSDKICLYISDDSLRPGTHLTLVLPSLPQSIVAAEVQQPADTACARMDETNASGQRYEIRLLGPALPPSMPVIAVSEFSGRFRMRGQYVTADLDRDGKPEYFRFCTTSEGVHLTVWTGRPLQGKRRWSQYYDLGYDVDVNCTPKDTETIRP
jgi:hypothetical protein